MSGPLAWIVVLLTACVSEIETSRPFFGPDHRADVLVEGRLLSNPHSVEQNRLLRGWRFVKGEDGRRLVPDDSESVVEFVNLDGRPRLLTIDVDDDSLDRESWVQARLGQRDLGRFPISGRIEVGLPENLPLGRVAVTLEFPKPEEPVIRSLSISPSLPAGEVDISENLIEQHGWSIVEAGHWVEVGDRFVVEFQPPGSPASGQRFAVTVEDPLGGLRQVFTWTLATESSTTSRTMISVPLVNEPGPVLIRMVAQGRGPSGHWINPRIVGRQIPQTPLGPPPIEEPPRLVVLYVMDALRSDHVGHLGPHRDLTPILDGIASEGVSLGNHFAVAPNTPPSTRALFSGLVMLDDRQLPHPGPPRMAEIFHQAGYRTVSITGNPHLSPELDLGVGFESVELLRVRESHNPKHPPTVNNSAEILHEAASRWIEDLGSNERGFIYIHTMNPHNPYTPPPEVEDRIAPSGSSSIDGRTRTLVAIRDLQRDVDPADVDRLRSLYAASVAYNDEEFAKLINTINRNFDPAEVLLVVTSDHGDELFEHGGVLHGYTLYDEMLRIPLIIRWPTRITPKKISSLTNTLDLHATLVELASSSPGGSTGTSLWPRLLHRQVPTPAHRVTFAAAPALAGGVMARSQRWKLISVPNDGIRRGQGKGRGRSWNLEYVFDLIDDPGEQHNLAGTADLEIAWLRTRLMAWVETQSALQPVPGDQVMDDETKDQLEALGYVVDP